MSQNTQILNHLRQHGTITARDAVHSLGCYRLAARIAELREQGHVIETNLISGASTGVKFAEYRLKAAA